MQFSDQKYPVLEVDLIKIYENTHKIVNRCQKSGVEVTGVVKGCNGPFEVAATFLSAGCTSIGSSRIHHLKNLRLQGCTAKMMFLRLPMLCEIDEMIEYAHISLNSERKVLKAINEACQATGKTHEVLLMCDMGDLREGVWTLEDTVDLAEYVETQLDSVHLLGIGTNLGCYGSIKPDFVNMTKLVSFAENIEKVIGRKLEIISGGATSSFPMLVEGAMPKRVNHLRIGEGILLSRDYKTYFGFDFENLSSDTFKLHAQIIEIQEKPSYPVGNIFIDAFGNKPVYKDIGLRKRALLAIGKQDFGDHSKLLVEDTKCQIVGSSSDHLIVDITESDTDYQVGDAMTFALYYQAMLHLSLSSDVYKSYIL